MEKWKKRFYLGLISTISFTIFINIFMSVYNIPNTSIISYENSNFIFTNSIDTSDIVKLSVVQFIVYSILWLGVIFSFLLLIMGIIKYVFPTIISKQKKYF